MLIFLKIRLFGAGLFYADRLTYGWTDRHDEANGSISQFCESLKNFWRFNKIAYTFFSINALYFITIIPKHALKSSLKHVAAVAVICDEAW